MKHTATDRNIALTHRTWDTRNRTVKRIQISGPRRSPSYSYPSTVYFAGFTGTYCTYDLSSLHWLFRKALLPMPKRNRIIRHGERAARRADDGAVVRPPVVGSAGPRHRPPARASAPCAAPSTPPCAAAPPLLPVDRAPGRHLRHGLQRRWPAASTACLSDGRQP